MVTHDGDDSPNRLGEALARLDSRSRRLVELWLAGLGRREIAAEMRIRDEVVGAIGETAFRRLRTLLNAGVDAGSGCAQPADGLRDEGAGEGPGPAMTHSRPQPGCFDGSAD